MFPDCFLARLRFIGSAHHPLKTQENHQPQRISRDPLQSMLRHRRLGMRHMNDSNDPNSKDSIRSSMLGWAALVVGAAAILGIAYVLRP